MAPQAAEYLLYNATLTLYRLSPLHFSPSNPLLSADSVQAHARRFGDALKGDVLRGMRVNFEGSDEGLTRSGTLKECRWTLLTRGEAAEEMDMGTQMNGADGFGVTEGIQVEVEYEKNTYIALLLRGNASPIGSRTDEVHLPLLALRMPGPLREMFLHYLAGSFDTRADIMHISSVTIGNMLESYLEICSRHGEVALTKIVKDLQLSLVFKGPVSPNLRALDIMIKREDTPRFIKDGQRMKDGRTETLKGARFHDGAFMVSLSQYLSSQLALDSNHAAISLSRIASGAFALGKEGKLKIFAPIFPSEDEDDTMDRAVVAGREATTRLLVDLLALAGGQIQSSESNT